MKVLGGYAYYDSFKPTNKKVIEVVVKTQGQLPRRFDGLIRAGGTFGGHGGGSMGSVGGKQTKCYRFSVPLKKDGRFWPAKDQAKGAKAVTGRSYTVVIHARGADGNDVSSHKSIKLRERKAGDRSGKPLGC